MHDSHADRFRPLLDDTTHHVKRGRWSVMAVGGDDHEPNFHYTVGLHCQGYPEVLVFGLPYETGMHVLNAVGDRFKEDIEISDGLLLEEIVVGYAVKLRDLGQLIAFHDESDLDYFRYLLRFARHHGSDPDTLRAVQLLWPDKEGRFPEEPGAQHADMPLLRGGRPD